MILEHDCVDLDESFETHIYLENFFSIQPRTSPVKFAERRVRCACNPERYEYTQGNVLLASAVGRQPARFTWLVSNCPDEAARRLFDRQVNVAVVI